MSEKIVPISTYASVFAALLALTGTTCGIAFLDLGPLNTIMAMTIAVIKALLVALVFMHLRYSRRLTQVVVAAGLFWLAILIALTLGDYFTRAWSATPPG
ncbi:MAG TPA: cytochrome C oxidase subunit IV family protein [Acidobacteriota bacterium]|jgi:cytochrome c oxidase subunit 4|nr:cytochrome C oxidase subunit IV family protein [Acidobacteriota bacterium]